MDPIDAPFSTRSIVSAARSQKLLTAPVGRTLIDLATPMAIGIAAIIAFQLADTYFMGRLGPDALAAMTFIFPVAFTVFSVTMGLGIGTTAVIARAIGEGDRRKVVRLTTHALILALLTVVIFAGLGLLTAPSLFRAMGASDTLVELIMTYMTPWLFGFGLLVIPMVGNGAIRATGDTKTPSLIMVIAGVTNLALGPLLIFGPGPFPRLGVRGAAIATVISWGVTFVAAMYLLIKRERMLSLRDSSWAEMWSSWKEVLHLALPAAGTNVLIPLSTGIITRIVADHGELAVAGFGVGQRLEALALIPINALSTALTPFVGQNYGSGGTARTREAVRFCTRASLLWGVFAAVLLALCAFPLARVFNDDATVVGVIASYARRVPLSYATLGIAMLMNTAFIAMGKPLWASLIIAVRLLVLAVPLAYLGSVWWGLDGVFVGIAVGNIVIGVLSVAMISRQLGADRKLAAARY